MTSLSTVYSDRAQTLADENRAKAVQDRSFPRLGRLLWALDRQNLADVCSSWVSFKVAADLDLAHVEDISPVWFEDAHVWVCVVREQLRHALLYSDEPTCCEWWTRLDTTIRQLALALARHHGDKAHASAIRFRWLMVDQHWTSESYPQCEVSAADHAALAWHFGRIAAGMLS